MAELNADQRMLVGELFERAAALPPEQRPVFLASECPDKDVRQEVASLLQHSGGGLPTAGQSIASVVAAAPGAAGGVSENTVPRFEVPP